MEHVRYLVVGAGVTGLAFADWIRSEDCLVLEALDAIGGYCRTVHQDGFTWDYSGHFFHFKRPEIERDLNARLKGELLSVTRDARVSFRGQWIDFPFQKNIHQLSREDFLDCLVDLYFRERSAKPAHFEEMLVANFGRAIADRFLIPYNEKLYATSLRNLDADAMGRFFPYAAIDDIVRHFRTPEPVGYNAVFKYPRGGAFQYIEALRSRIGDEKIRIGTPVLTIDLKEKTAHTPAGPIRFEYLVSSMPFDRLLRASGVPFDRSLYSSNKVEVFNLGFDSKGPLGVHWLYVPDHASIFYRVGFYDNIFGDARMSLYVEIGHPSERLLPEDRTEETLERVLRDLRREGIVTTQKLVSFHRVVLDPAYVHIHRAGVADVAKNKALLAARGIYSLGRYGSWTYCSIEDNIVEARELADMFNRLDP